MEEKVWAVFWSIVVICMTVMTVKCTSLYNDRIAMLTAHGYEQTTLQGEGGWAWVKTRGGE